MEGDKQEDKEMKSGKYGKKNSWLCINICVLINLEQEVGLEESIALAKQLEEEEEKQNS